MQHYVTYHSTRFADGRTVSHYRVGVNERLTDELFNEWLTRAMAQPDGPHAVSVLVIREYRDRDDALCGWILERRRQTADGAYYGDPARVEVTGVVRQVRTYRATGDGTLEAGAPEADQPAAGAARDELFAGEEQAVRAAYGEAVRILAVRDPSVLEDRAGQSSIIHLTAQDGRELACGLGWHGTTPFLIEAGFPRIEGDAAADAADGLAGSQSRLLSADQAVWARYAERYQQRVILEVRPHGASGEVLVLAGDAAGQVGWHLIDSDGVEVWRKSPEELLGGRSATKGDADVARDRPATARGRARRA